MTDSFRSKVYEAEQEVRFIVKNAEGGPIDFFGSTLYVPEPRKFGDLDGVQRYVDAVCGMTQIRNAYPAAKVPPKVIARRGDSKATYQMGVIRVPDHKGSNSSWAMNELVVLHELAHHFSLGDGHGTRFCLTFMDLIANVIGPELKLMLMRALDSRGVPLS